MTVLTTPVSPAPGSLGVARSVPRLCMVDDYREPAVTEICAYHQEVQIVGEAAWQGRDDG